MHPTTLRTATLTAPLLLAATLTGCSGPGEDVRVTLCKGVTEVLLDGTAPLDWKTEENKMGRWVDLAMKLGFDTPAKAGQQTVCHYQYRSPTEENIITDTQPLAVYATRPFKVVLNGASVTGKALDDAINEAVLRQGKAFAEKVKQGALDTVDKVREEFRKGEGN